MLNYTLPQAQAFLTALDRQDARALSDLLTVIATGSQGNPEQLRKLHKALAC